MLCAAGVSGCGQEPAVLALDVGRETNTLSEAPAPTRWEVGFTASAAGRVVVGGGTWPSNGLEVELDPDLVGAFDVVFEDGAGEVLAVGAAPTIVARELSARRLPLFVQRRGAFARPTPDLDGRAAPAATVVGQRIVVVGGGTVSLAAFDLALMQGLAAQSLPVSAEALAATNAAVFAAAGARLVRLDLQSAATSEVVVPSTVNAAELAGAPLVSRGSGFAWVGPARAGKPSSAVLFVDADETVHLARVPTAASQCAAAAMADGAVLLACAGGAWRVAPDGSATAVPFPAYLDARGVALPVAALTTLDDGTIAAVAGGHAYRVPAGCDSACVPEDQGAVPCAGHVQLVALGAEALLACDDENGRTHALRLQTAAPVVVELRESRRQATLVAISSREAALVGGGPASFERYRPR